MTVDEVCKALMMGRSALYDRWAAGTGPRYSQVGRNRLVRVEWLDDYLMSCEVAA